MRGQRQFPGTYCNHHSGSDTSVQRASCKLHSIISIKLYSAVVGNCLLIYSDISVLTQLEVMNLSLAVSLALQEALPDCYLLNEHQDIIEDRLGFSMALHAGRRLKALS